MPLLSDLITEITQRKNYTQRQINWMEGENNSDSYYIGGHSFTGTGGRTAFWADWRTNNASLDGSNGTDNENFMWSLWNDFTNGTPVALPSGTLTAWQTVVSDCNSKIAEYQALIDSGETEIA